MGKTLTDRIGLLMLVVSVSPMRFARSGLFRRNVGTGLSLSRSGSVSGSSLVPISLRGEDGPGCIRMRRGSCPVSFKMDLRGLLVCDLIGGTLSFVDG
jgi:hypothetical protein